MGWGWSQKMLTEEQHKQIAQGRQWSKDITEDLHTLDDSEDERTIKLIALTTEKVINNLIAIIEEQIPMNVTVYKDVKFTLADEEQSDEHS